MVEEVGERAFDLHLDALGNQKRLAKRGREVDGTRAVHDSGAGVTKTADRSNVGRRVVADGASLADAPTRRAWANKSGGVKPLAGGRVGKTAIRDAVRVLGTALINTRSRSRWIAIAEIRGFERTGLQKEDVAQPPSAQYGIRKAVRVRHEVAATAEWQLVDGCGERAELTSAPYRPIFGLQVIEVHAPASGVFARERTLRRRPLIVGQIPGISERRVKRQAMLEPVG